MDPEGSLPCSQDNFVTFALPDEEIEHTAQKFLT